LGRDDIFKPTIGNESLHQDSKDNGVRIVTFATSNMNTPGSLLMGRFTTRLITYVAIWHSSILDVRTIFQGSLQ